MRKIQIKNLEKNIGNKQIFKIKDIQINSGDRVGIVGKNGSGKTTLLKMILGEDKDYIGDIFLDKNDVVEYVSQNNEGEKQSLNGKYASLFDVDTYYRENMSGGEKTRFKIASSLYKNPDILLLDEPTSNLDLQGIKLFNKNMKNFKGVVLLVSHDRDVLDDICNKILEIDDGLIEIYIGNYSQYKRLKQEKLERKYFEYDEYVKEKNRLIKASENIAKKSNDIKRTPSRMGNSEARLHRMGGQKNKMKLDNNSKSIDTRIEKLIVKERPKDEKIIKLTLLETSKIHSKVLISGENINLEFEENIIFKNAKFTIENGRKIGLIGDNGVGKTTFLKMILSGEFNISNNLKIAYFSQNMDILDNEKTILQNIMSTSIYDENFSRLILGRLLFKGDRVKEKVEHLSGGEKVKVSLAKIILQDSNFLILDEPTNYLDINSLEVLEDLLKTYEGNVLLVSHDKRFIDNIVDEVLVIKDFKLEKFLGNIKEYENKISIKNDSNLKTKLEKKLILENEISEIISLISIETNDEKKLELDKKYIEKLRALKKI